MPLFGSHNAKADEHASREEMERAKADEKAASKSDRRTSLPPWSRNRSRTTPSPERPQRRGSILARFREHPSRELSDDPSIKAARQKVTDAEHAERDADRALDLARRAVREARQHVKELEAAAIAEVKRARAKQQEAKSIRKGTDRLGRHDHS